jgi:hypothetical protein
MSSENIDSGGGPVCAKAGHWGTAGMSELIRRAMEDEVSLF